MTAQQYLTLHIDVYRLAQVICGKLEYEGDCETIAQFLDSTVDSAELSAQVTYMLADKYTDCLTHKYELDAALAQSVTEFIDNMTEVGGVYIEQDTEY